MFKNTISQDLQDAIKKVMHTSSPVAEALVGNQHKIDKNKNGKIDAHDFKLIKGQKAAPVKEEQTDEAMSHQAATTMKHIPNASPALKKAAKDIKPGIAGYRDRIAMLKAGGVKEEVEELDELSKTTLGSYAKKASRDAVITRKIGADFEHQGKRAKSPGMKAASDELSQKYKSKSWQRRDGVDKAVDRLTKEEVELGEAKSLHKMSADELDQAHKDNEAKIAAIHKNDSSERITKSHPLIFKRRSINLHKVIRSKQSNPNYILPKAHGYSEEVEIDEARKLEGTYSHTNGNQSKVYKLSGEHHEGDPYHVKLFKAGKHYEPADYFTNDKEDAHGTAKHMVKEEVELDEGSGPKEKQKTPFRNINGPEYKAAADKQRQQMAKDKAAEPGKKMLDKKGMAEGWDDMLKANKERATAADKAKGTGKFDKKELSPGSTQYTRKSKTFTDGGSDADLRKANRKSNEEVDETTVIHNSYTVNLKETYTFGEYLLAAKSIVGEDEAVIMANEAFGTQDVGIFEQALTIENMIEEMNTLEEAGHSISEPKYNTELGNPYYEYTVTEETGARRKYIHYGDVVTN